MTIDHPDPISNSKKSSAMAVITLNVPEKVIVHPLVLLSVVDHYNRVAKNTQKRVVGVLLGQYNTTEKYVNVANSFAIPFEEDEKDPSVWFLDHNYVESMSDMFRKVNAKEKMIGWYHTGPKLRSSDLFINELFKRFIKDPVLVVVDVNPDHVGLPTDSYFSIEEIKDDGTPTTRTFIHVPSSVEAEEAEEIGVEHLLRDIKNSQVGTLSSRIQDRFVALKSLIKYLEDIQGYLKKVVDGRLPVHHAIVYNLQDVFNFLPRLEEPARAFHIQINDQWMVMYIASLIRSVLALHDLIDNKLQNKDNEEQSTTAVTVEAK
ncbi:proteasome regulatory particle subunit [Coelomomyces lativittatus]|nr:proteasome regulatory particle subunit [Coelomomyces lativittatus]KAJ1503093.1 proteasome regulatory particle subunit [Coelomomyces lativittatus]KAJ1506116.1 proteasome regulatory particle subunit [Coelomomyces lativittatus]